MTSFVPHEYQELGIQHALENEKCALWYPMGAGKTATVLSVIEILKLAGSNFFPWLVLAPPRVARGVWPRETQEWDHLEGLTVSSIAVEDTTPAKRQAALRKKADIYTCNYEQLPWLYEQLKHNWPFRGVVSDESTRLKGFRLRKGTKRAAVLGKVAHKAGRWINLTGTPSPNGLIDLWGQTWFLDRGQRLGRTYTAFLERWFKQCPYTRAITALPHAQWEIPALVSDICMSVDLNDYFDIQQPLVTPVKVDLPAKVMRQYLAMEEDLFTVLKSGTEVEAFNGAAKSAKCLQMASGAVYTDDQRNWEQVHDAKLDGLASVIEECAGNPLLVSYWWRHDHTRIMQKFPFAREIKTQQDEDDWNAGKILVGLVHPARIGHGANLQHGGHRIAYFSDWWDLELRQQIMERIGPVRQIQAGYDRVVLEYPIIARGTLDELVVVRHSQKRSVQDLLMEAAKSCK